MLDRIVVLELLRIDRRMSTHPDKAICFMSVVHSEGILRLVALGENEIARVIAKRVSCQGGRNERASRIGDWGVQRSGCIGYWTYVAAPVTRDHIVTLNYNVISG